MFYVGLDIHSKRISVSVLSETGHAVHRAQARTIDEMMRILEALHERFESATRPVAATATTTTSQPDRCSGHSGPSGSIWADLSLEGQERPQGCRAAGEAVVRG
jgi:hypothetical protein